MRLEFSQNEHQNSVNARALESLQETPALKETIDIEMIHDHVPARHGKLVELTAPCDFVDGVFHIIESPETPDSLAFVLPTMEHVKHRKVDVIVSNRDVKNEHTPRISNVRFSPIDQT